MRSNVKNILFRYGYLSNRANVKQPFLLTHVDKIERSFGCVYVFSHRAASRKIDFWAIFAVLSAHRTGQFTFFQTWVARDREVVRPKSTRASTGNEANRARPPITTGAATINTESAAPNPGNIAVRKQCPSVGGRWPRITLEITRFQITRRDPSRGCDAFLKPFYPRPIL